MTDEEIQRHLHGELPADDSARVAEHLAVCAECSAAVQEARHVDRDVASILARLDHTPPPLSAQQIVNARQPAYPWRYAAGIVLAIGAAGIVYAWPGSPLRDWLDRARTESRVAAPTSTAPAASTETVGVAVLPAENFAIAFLARQPTGVIRVSFADEPDAVIRASDSGIQFTARRNEVIVDNTGSTGNYDVVLPRTLRAASIRVAGAQVYSTGQRTPADSLVHIPLR